MKYLVNPLLRFVCVVAVYILCYPIIFAVSMLSALWEWNFKDYNDFFKSNFCDGYDRATLSKYHYKTPLDYLRNKKNYE